MDSENRSWDGGYRGAQHRTDISDREWAAHLLKMHEETQAYLQTKLSEQEGAIMPRFDETDEQLRQRIRRMMGGTR